MLSLCCNALQKEEGTLVHGALLPWKYLCSLQVATSVFLSVSARADLHRRQQHPCPPDVSVSWNKRAGIRFWRLLMQTFRITNEILKQTNKQKPRTTTKMTKHKPSRFKNLGIIVGKKVERNKCGCYTNSGFIPALLFWLRQSGKLQLFLRVRAIRKISASV